MIVLGIETSCDETSAAIVKNGRYVLSNIVASSIKQHKKYQGIIPEIASRAHIESISAVVEEALREASKKNSDIDLICATSEPGLIGSLLVGISFAKALSFALQKPMLEVNHLHAHLYANLLSANSRRQLKPPFIGLVVSGGHTCLFYVSKKFDFNLLGTTTDDAAGEAFDKVAKILNAGYPGGPVIEKMALKGNTQETKFSCKGHNGLNFSFSGIKTAVLYKTKELSTGHKSQITSHKKKNIAAAFQKAVVDTLIEKSLLACRIYKIKTLVVGGGVSANNCLRRRLTDEGKLNNIKVYFPELKLSLDNAAMIAGLGYQLYKKRGGER